MKYLYIFLLAVSFFILGAWIDRSYGDNYIRNKKMICDAKIQSVENAMSTFCTLMQGQLTPEECIRTDYIKSLGQETTNKAYNRCMGFPEAQDTRNAVPTSSEDLQAWKNINPTKHR